MHVHQTLVLTHRQIEQKIRRMAYEIYERNIEEQQLLLAGISGMGFRLANLLAEELRQHFSLEVEVSEVRLDKAARTQGDISISSFSVAADSVCILVDDVLNTGRTLAFAMKPFLGVPLKKLELAVLVNRRHRCYPVSPDYTGLALATTLNEHIHVDLKGPDYAVYLH
ncbi:MAG: phosphoribosyltransferase family protein [Nitritalea sp.]